MEYLKLKEVADIYLGLTHTPKYVESGIPFLSVKDISGGNIDFSNCHYITEDEYNSLPKGAKPECGDMLFCRVGTIGKPIIIKDGIPKFGSFVSLGFLRRKNNNILAEYLKYWMNSNLFYKQVKQNVKGVAQINLNTTWLKEFDIPKISIIEQKNIVDKLSKIERLIKMKNTEIEKLNQLIKSQFVEMFGNIKNNENFDYITIGDVVDKNIIKLKKNFKMGEEIKYIDISSIDNTKNIMTGYTKYLVGEEPSRAQQCLKYNDIVVSTVRPNLKNVAMNKYTYENIIGTSGFCVLRCNRCRVEYLMYILLSDDFTNDMCSITTGANYPAIHNEDIYNYKIPDAPIELQNKFAQIVEQIDKQKFEFEKSLKKLEELQASLMQEYFG